MIYETIDIFVSKLTGEVCICWDDIHHGECTRGYYFYTIGM